MAAGVKQFQVSSFEKRQSATDEHGETRIKSGVILSEAPACRGEVEGSWFSLDRFLEKTKILRLAFTSPASREPVHASLRMTAGRGKRQSALIRG
jgi:hypothetical protein